MISNIKPIYLLSDSQLLFSRDTTGQYFLASVKDDIGKVNIKAVYIGWSNGNQPEFYELFKEGMKNLQIMDCRMISSEFTATDKQDLQHADLILLAGGDVIAGWERLSETGAAGIIKERYVSGAVLIGISAGAIQLGDRVPFAADNESVEMMKLVPYIIGAHDEANQWSDLKKAVHLSGTEGIGIPFGTGFKYYSDQRIEIINKDKELFYYIR
ncbi:Type 1 glutamine amidotransferase-like domain-containing protein [Fulvivirga ulvae]|uniref:Type 1 glutamine amidotransferase-like domain-containing protein n=1 Tax=Fulvivirga ulvae TaxID=2904245 RepID=UPI001F181521|nr:Type 1 glutamine amidotransferase-like domain-containing protein [Fulvivirga ulvae]UII30110.1 Type 1 glutamine amidotransferase-like domain-containing protein [Fulvivirga ulvae]